MKSTQRTASFSGRKLRIMTQMCRCSVRHQLLHPSHFSEIHLNECVCLCVSLRLPLRAFDSRKPDQNTRAVLVSFASVSVSSEDVSGCITSKPDRQWK